MRKKSGWGCQWYCCVRARAFLWSSWWFTFGPDSLGARLARWLLAAGGCCWLRTDLRGSVAEKFDALDALARRLCVAACSLVVTCLAGRIQHTCCWRLCLHPHSTLIFHHLLPSSPLPLLTDTVAQTILYNCSFPSSRPCLSHHPTDDGFAQIYPEKLNQSSNSSTTFHNDKFFWSLQNITWIGSTEFTPRRLPFSSYRWWFLSGPFDNNFWDKNYDNLVSLFQAISPATTDSNHIFICGVQSLVTMLPQHLSQYDIKHIITTSCQLPFNEFLMETVPPSHLYHI